MSWKCSITAKRSLMRALYLWERQRKNEIFIRLSKSEATVQQLSASMEQKKKDALLLSNTAQRVFESGLVNSVPGGGFFSWAQVFSYSRSCLAFGQRLVAGAQKIEQERQKEKEEQEKIKEAMHRKRNKLDCLENRLQLLNRRIAALSEASQQLEAEETFSFKQAKLRSLAYASSS